MKSLIQIINEFQRITKGPTGHCYQNVNNYNMNNDLPNIKIIHGEASNANGKMIKHAWIIDDNNVIDPTLGIIMAKNEYYKKFNTKDKYIFTSLEAIKMMMQTKHHGEWNTMEIKKFLNR